MILLWLLAWFKNVYPVNPNLSVYGALQNFDYALDYKLITTIIALGLFVGIFKFCNGFKTSIYMLTGITIFGILITKEMQILQYTNFDDKFLITIVQFLMILFLGYLLLLNEENKSIEIIFEYGSLINAIFGMLIFFGFALAIEAFTFYTLVNLKQKNIFSAEGAIASGMIILGIGLLYGQMAKTNFIEISELFPKELKFYGISLGGLLLISGLLFNIGANIIQQYFFVFFVCIASAIIGSVQAVVQTKFKRFLAFTIIFNNSFFTSLILLSGINAFMSLMESIMLYLIVFFYHLLRKFTRIIYHLFGKFRRAFSRYMFCSVPVLASTDDLTSNFIFFGILTIPLVTYTLWKVFTMRRNKPVEEPEPITAPNNPKVVEELITAPKVVEEPITAPNNHKVVDVVQVSQSSNAREIYMERQKFDNYVNINTLPDCGYPKELSHAVLRKLETDCIIGFEEAKASGFIWCIDQCFRLDVPLTKSGYKYLIRWLHANDINTILEDNSYNYRNVLDHLTTYTELNFSWINLTHPNIVLDSYRRGTGNYNILDSEYDFYSLKDGIYPKTLSANVLSDIYSGTTGLKREEEFLERIGDLYYNKHIPLSVSGYYFLKDWYISNKIPFMPDNPIYDPLVDFLTNFADTFNL